jgi:hypothetical protein
MCTKPRWFRILNSDRVTLLQDFFLLQLSRCRGNCGAVFAATTVQLSSCQQCCNQFPAQSCQACCDTSFLVSAENANCRAACSNGLCILGADTVTFQTGIAATSLQPFCPATSVPVCQSGAGSDALGTVGLFIVVLKTTSGFLRFLHDAGFKT